MVSPAVKGYYAIRRTILNPPQAGLLSAMFTWPAVTLTTKFRQCIGITESSGNVCSRVVKMRMGVTVSEAI